MEQLGDKPEEVREHLKNEQARAGKDKPSRTAERKGEEPADRPAADEEPGSPEADR
ncbi:hypothetical protein AB0N17_05365 [Streptomyces sp. NPDC051133]|uniref:hypothetical protein n=1 Tax=Streptomyces sp. NPDC051133 TaxID=3155521 RepID=UPI003416809A